MITCPYCKVELPDDSVYCINCGKKLVKDENDKEDVFAAKQKLKKNPNTNILAQLGLIILVSTLVFLDFVIGAIVQQYGGNVKIVFYISTVLYIGVIICGILSLLVDKNSKKNGYEPTGDKMMAYTCIVLGFYLIIVNVQNVLL